MLSISEIARVLTSGSDVELRGCAAMHVGSLDPDIVKNCIDASTARNLLAHAIYAMGKRHASDDTSSGGTERATTTSPQKRVVDRAQPGSESVTVKKPRISSAEQAKRKDELNKTLVEVVDADFLEFVCDNGLEVNNVTYGSVWDTVKKYVSSNNLTDYSCNGIRPDAALTKALGVKSVIKYTQLARLVKSKVNFIYVQELD